MIKANTTNARSSSREEDNRIRTGSALLGQFGVFLLMMLGDQL